MKKITAILSILFAFHAVSAKEIGKAVVPAKTKKETLAKADKKTILVKPKITKKDLGYRYFGVDWYPEKLSIETVDEKGNTLVLASFDGKSDPITNEHPVAVGDDGTLELKYKYSFHNGYKKDEKVVPYKITDVEKKSAEMAFNWKDPHHILLANADPIAKKNEKPKKAGRKRGKAA